MAARFPILLAGLLPISTAAAATGVSPNSTTLLSFTTAAALILTLLVRRPAILVARGLASRLGAMRIRRLLERHNSHVLHDFILPGAYGGLVHIDHAVMTNGGLLCVQAKHLSGMVFGSESDPQWNVVDGLARRRFLNPLIQNEGRCRAMRAVVPDVPVVNVVVFTGASEFAAPPPGNVMQVSELQAFIAKYEAGAERIDHWDGVWMSLRSAALTDEATRRDHAAQLSFS